MWSCSFGSTSVGVLRMLCSTCLCAVTYGNGERRQHSGPSDVRFFSRPHHPNAFSADGERQRPAPECAPALASISACFVAERRDERLYHTTKRSASFNVGWSASVCSWARGKDVNV